MRLTVKNTFALGVILLAGVVAWLWVELSRSYELITTANAPVLSADRGFSDATIDFSRNRAKFVSVFVSGGGHVIPGISEDDLTGELAGYWQEPLLMCGTGFHLYKDFALNVGGHENNKFYAQAYNTKLLELAKKMPKP
ncbi:hypothetical protein MO867_12130 [Microbulbifer sp. OS29]|uniref:Uncharacterized protein n=1 Tax=Microbulbifer okhotskensis TaxID=2926617 RepID=A0A9X2ENR6_9GAMM|nr:hypothetical protein [Microbulbifer okhotskensis]MCO1335081.1 hypothetical protein [Microbulbifer okhotskensis]